MMNLLAAMSGGAEEEERALSRAGSMDPIALSGRTPEWAYATEALSAEMKPELVRIILYRKMTGTMRESRALVRSVNACQRAESALLLVEVATSALDEIAEGDVPPGNGGENEMELLLEIQKRDRKMLEMSAVRGSRGSEAGSRECRSILKMSARCEEAEKLRSECVHVLELGAEKDESIDLLQEEIARMKEERMADDVENLAENLRKEISELQAKYQQACESASELQSRLESIEGVLESVGCQNEGDVQRGFERLQELEKSTKSIQECFAAFECKSVEELRNAMLDLKAERDVQATVLEVFKGPGVEEGQSPQAARGSMWTKRSVEPSSNFESSIERSPAAEAREKTRRSLNGVAERIKKDLASSILNQSDQERSLRRYGALGLLEATDEGDGMEEEDRKRLSLIELDATALETTLAKVQKAADEKTGKHFSFRTEEMLIQHVQAILETVVPSRDVLLGALDEVTIEEAILTLQSRYEYVRDEITGTTAATKLPFEVRLSKMKNQDQKILMTVVETAFCKVSSNFQTRCT
jgi:hypothetical protein